MIVDTSAIVAILLDEDDAETYLTALAEARTVRISAASYLETGIAIDQARTRSRAGTSTTSSGPRTPSSSR